MQKYLALLTACLLLMSCGGTDDTDPFSLDDSVPTQVLPVVARIVPAQGKSGDTITIFGSGFSVALPYNLISFGENSVVANSYTLLPAPIGTEIESLTFIIPGNAKTGATQLFVTVLENSSNADKDFTVLP